MNVFAGSDVRTVYDARAASVARYRCSSGGKHKKIRVLGLPVATGRIGYTEHKGGLIKPP